MIPGGCPAWLERAVLYYILPQSFHDANGDGIGDLAGIRAKLDYVVDLGITALCLAPCFDSPFRNGGWDVADHCRVAPRYGSNEDLEGLIQAAHRADVRVCLELVAPFTSDRHRWFESSARSTESELPDRYIWTDDPRTRGSGELEFVAGAGDRRGAYAFEEFPYQPLLNYGFAERRAAWERSFTDPGPAGTLQALKDVMQFWLERDVDGFWVHGAASLVKRDPGAIATRRLWQGVREWLAGRWPDRVLLSRWSHPELAIDAGFHADFIEPGAVGGHDALLAAPDPLPPGGRAGYFDARGRGDFAAFLDAFEFQRTRVRAAGLIGLASSGPRRRRPRAHLEIDDLKVLYTFLFTWPLVPCLYYGDELGMRQLSGLSSREGAYEHAGARTPMQWSPAPGAGFSTRPDAEPIHPLDPGPERPDVETARRERDSLWSHIERLIYLRATEPDLAHEAPLALLTSASPGYPLLYRRGESVIVALNPGGEARTVELDHVGDAAPLVAHHCHLSLASGRWTARVGPAGYGVFSVR